MSVSPSIIDLLLTTISFLGVNNFIAVVRQNYLGLLGTAGSWFILDIVFYANGLFSGQVTKVIGNAATVYEESVNSLILNVRYSSRLID